VGPIVGDKKEALLRSAWVFVHTSRWEGMPVAVLEALGAGCPVVLTAATGLGEFVEEYGAGVVVEGSAPAIQEGLRTVLEASPGRYQAMRAAALRLASERFTWTAVAQQMAAAYRSILQ
jgi:glycosyltransferase involved in cell wall biosynthesis